MKKKLLTLIVLAGFASCQNESVQTATPVAKDPNTVYATDPPTYDPNMPSNTGKMTYLDWETKKPITGAELTAKTALFGNYTITASDFIWPTIVGSSTVYDHQLNGWNNFSWSSHGWGSGVPLGYMPIGSYFGPYGYVINQYLNPLNTFNTSPLNSQKFINTAVQVMKDASYAYLSIRYTGKNSFVGENVQVTYNATTHRITSASQINDGSRLISSLGINGDGNLVVSSNIGKVKITGTYGVNGDVKGFAVGVNGGTVNSLYNYNSPNDHSYQVTYQNKPWKVEVKGGVDGNNKFYGSGALSNGGITGQIKFTQGMIGGSIDIAMP